MSTGQKFVFTALPAFHIVNNEIKASVSAVVTIQLEAGENSTLALFQDIRQWPEKIDSTNFKLKINGAEFPVTLVKKDLLNGNMYRNLFTDKIKVRSYKKENQDLTIFPIKSYPVKHITGFIEDTYQYVGTEKSDVLPDEEFFTSKWTDLKALSEWSIKEDLPDSPPKLSNSPFHADFYTQNDFLASSPLATFRDTLKRNKITPFKAEKVPAADFAQLKNFHTAETSKLSHLNNTRPSPKVPDFEYHDILSILSGYPLLQRKLGLVLDFDIPEQAIAALGKQGTIRIIPAGIHFKDAATISCPPVAYEKTEKGFYLQPANGSAIDKGLLKINNNPEFMVVQFDTDGAALKLCNQADNLVLSRARHLSLLSEAHKKRSFKNQEEHENYNQRNEGLPTLRSSGIGIVRNGHAGVLFSKFERSKNLYDFVFSGAASGLPDNRDPVTFLYPSESLNADDLVQGYRMDIYDHAYKLAHPEKGEKDGWFSLHRRMDTYSYAPTGKGTKILLGSNEEDEGFIQISAAQETGGEKALAVGEVIARWEGWSLSVRKPGIAINNPAPGKDTVNKETEEKKKYLLPDFVDFRLETDSKIVKGSLPRLRFGRKYKIKIRVVDLAGNSLPCDYEPENSNDTVINDIVYRRYDPTPTPVIKYASEIRDGESLERMVIRSNIKLTAEEYEGRVIDRMRFLPVATRHFQAPRTTQIMAELHDMFEGIGREKQNSRTRL
ncbi:MAG: hypothetical protein IPP73_12825 [Chitinophagaceae bacterium]|nr:hypothetical protein [Chitinophagaceae bacterium]